MKKLSIKNYILILVALLVAGCSIWLPGFMMHKDTNAYYDSINDVPAEYYSGPSESIITNASKQLNSEQCIQLITGVWSSEVTPVSEDECTFTDFGMKTLTISHVQDLYTKKLYPVSLSTADDSWYTWDAKPYRALDTTFRTYGAIFWDIRYTKYDGTETHRFIVSESGDIIYAEAYTKESFGKFSPELSNASYLLDYLGSAVYYTSYSISSDNDNVTTSVTIDDHSKTFNTDSLSATKMNSVKEQINNAGSFITDYEPFEPDDSIRLTESGSAAGVIKYSLSTKSTYNSYKMILLPEKTD